MNILIRCDSNNIIGTGHVMRCLNMCEYHPENKYTFVCKNYELNIADKIRKANHNLILLDYKINPVLTDYKSWLGDSNEIEKAKMIKILSDDSYDELFIDHYGYNEKIEFELSKYCKKITVLTDIFNFSHYCDELICFSSDDFNRLKSICIKDNTLIKFGKDHVIINKKFKDNKKNDIRKIQKIIIMLGGSDPSNFTLQILKSLDTLFNTYKIKVTIVVGALNTHLDTIRNFAFYKEYYNIKINLSYDDLIQEYLDHDLCIGSLSVTAYERLAMNMTQICLKIADNQNIQNLKEFNICNISTIYNKLLNFLENNK